MTKFTTIEKKVKERKTIFKKFVSSDFKISTTNDKPTDFDNVLHIGNDECYGDVFKTWDNGAENDFTIYFGKAGNEFN